MEMLYPPPPLCLTGNVAENWRKWEQRFNLYLAASALVDKSESRQFAVLLHCIGEEALDISNSLVIEYEDPQHYQRQLFGNTVPHERILSLNDISSGPTHSLSKQA